MAKSNKPLNIYPEHYYDKDGYLKPPKILYFSIVYLLRGYIIIALSSSYGSNTETLLNIFYPQLSLLYIHLIIGIPALVSFVLLTARFTLREKQRFWPLKTIKPLILLGLIMDVILHIHIAQLQYWQFDWVLGGQLFIAWLLLYFVTKAKQNTSV